MKVEEQFIDDVLSMVPQGPARARIEMDLRGHLAERVEHGHSMEEAIRQFGDPALLAESYLASTPLVSASFWSRALAKLIDIPAIVAVACAIVWSAWTLFGADGQPFFPGILQPGPLVLVICVLTVVTVIPGYFVIAEFLTGQTLGKRVLGLHVVRESGARISLWQSIVRQIPLVGEFFFIDVLFAPFTAKKQRAFELITKTRVVRVEAS